MYKNQNNNIIYQLDYMLNIQKKRLFIIDVNDEFFLRSLEKNINRKYENAEIWSTMNISSSSIKLISADEFNDLKRLYMLYEFSDRICLMSSSLIFPDLSNYLKTGILTEEELLEALL